MEKRNLIMEKALELFAEKGFQDTSVQEITDRSGISKGAFYLSFKSKDDLILALIHNYLQTVIADIDRLVRNKKGEDVLYDFYAYHLKQLEAQSGMAKLFMREQVHFLNEQFFASIRIYDEMLQDLILKMLENIYGEEVKETKYDLLVSMQGLLRSYMELLLLSNIPLNLDQLSRSLVEKTRVLQSNIRKPGISYEMYDILKKRGKEKVSKEIIVEAIEEALQSVEGMVERQSLVLLQKEIEKPSLQEAVRIGLLKNIEDHPNCIRVVYLLKLYWNS